MWAIGYQVCVPSSRIYITVDVHVTPDTVSFFFFIETTYPDISLPIAAAWFLEVKFSPLVNLAKKMQKKFRLTSQTF